MMDSPLNVSEYVIPSSIPAQLAPDTTGFPFDDTESSEFGRPRNSSFRHQLDDIASRHPEFAEHLRPWVSDFPSFRNNTDHWGRKRHPSGSCGEDDNRSQASGVSSSSNESTQFPEGGIFDSDLGGIPENLRRRFENRRTPSNKTERPSRPVTSDLQSEESEKPRRPIPQYGLRNTVDLGQKQQVSFDEDNCRGQRSMSAPPDNRSNQAKFVTRTNIDPSQPEMGNTLRAPKPPKVPEKTQHQQSPKQPTVRTIPIHVEGRDEPLLPKNHDQDQPRPQQSQPQHSFFTGSTPQPFASRDNSPRQNVSYQQSARPQQQYNPQQQHFESKQQPPQFNIPTQFEMKQPQPQASQPPRQEEHVKPHPPPQQQVAADPISKIQIIQKDVLELMTQVENFTGTSRKDKQYLYLDEMLTRNLLKLDNIETEGKDNIRQARKEAIKCIEKCISILEAKANANAAKENKEGPNELSMEVEPEKNPEEQKQEPIQIPDVTITEKQEPMEIEATPATAGGTTNTETTDAPPQTLEVGGIARSGSKVQIPKSDSKEAVQTESGVQHSESCETPKKKGKLSTKKVDQSADKVTKTDNAENAEATMEVEVQSDATNNSALQDASQNQDAPKNAT